MSYSHSHFLRKSPLTAFIFPECLLSYKEVPLRRNMRPTFHHFLEVPKALTRVTDQFCLIDERSVSYVCCSNPYGASTAVQTKRAIAHHVGSICAYHEWQLAWKIQNSKSGPRHGKSICKKFYVCRTATWPASSTAIYHCRLSRRYRDIWYRYKLFGHIWVTQHIGRHLTKVVNISSFAAIKR